MMTIRYWYDWWIAYLRLDPNTVCKMSVGRGKFDDFHDYEDTIYKLPHHFVELECERCGKKFWL